MAAAAAAYMTQQPTQRLIINLTAATKAKALVPQCFTNIEYL
jgi:hypothetical protein